MEKKLLDLLSSLSMKTVKKGATAAEEEAAFAMIKRLQQKYNLKGDFVPRHPDQQTKHSGIKEDKATILDRYRKYVKEDSIHLHVLDLDWDTLAEKLFNNFKHMEYLNKTYSTWVSMNKTRLGIRDKKTPYVTKDDYRQKCYQVFSSLKGIS